MSEDRLTRLIRMTARNEDQRRRRYLTKPPRLIPPRIQFETVDPGALQPGSEPIAHEYGIVPAVVKSIGANPVGIVNFQTTAWWLDEDEERVGRIGGKRPEKTAALDPFSNFAPE